MIVSTADYEPLYKNIHYIIDEEKLNENLNKLLELENQADSIYTEKAETPAEQRSIPTT